MPVESDIAFLFFGGISEGHKAVFYVVSVPVGNKYTVSLKQKNCFIYPLGTGEVLGISVYRNKGDIRIKLRQCFEFAAAVTQMNTAVESASVELQSFYHVGVPVMRVRKYKYSQGFSPNKNMISA